MPLPTKNAAPLRENAQDIAYQQLREWIVEGPLEAGEVLRDLEIAELLGVSRTPVREALIRLAQEGLVEFARGRSTRVAQLRYERAPDLYRVGGELDGLAAELAAPHMHSDRIARMRDVLSQMAIESNMGKLKDLDEMFHGVYYECSGSEILVEHLEQINFELRRLERIAFRDATIRAEAYQEHTAIIDAFIDRDGLKARMAARENWMNSWQRIHQRIAIMLPAPQIAAAAVSGAQRGDQHAVEVLGGERR